MPVSSIVDLYTTLLAWHMYGALWNLLVGTGLIILPFLIQIILVIMEDSQQQKKDVKQFVRTLEFKIYPMLVVMMICAAPAIDLNTETMEYNHAVCVVDEELGPVRKVENFAFGETETSAESYRGQFTTTFNGDQLRVPLWWWAFGKLSQAATFSMKMELPCAINIQLIADGAASVRIEDPVLAKEVGQFNRDCWKRSTVAYLKNINQNDYEPAPDKLDLTWIGSNYFLNNAGYYDSFRAQKPVKEFAWNETRDASMTTQEAAQDRGFPMCDQWWEPTNSAGIDGLRGRLLDVIKSDPDYLGECETCWGANFRRWADNFLGTELQREKDDTLLMMFLSSSVELSADFNASNEVVQSGGDGFLDSFKRNFQNIYQTNVANAGLLVNRISASGNTEAMMIKSSAPVVQALVLMFFVMMLPLLMTMSFFDIGRIMTLTVIFFVFIFWGYLFSLASYVDNVLVDSLATTLDDAESNKTSMVVLSTQFVSGFDSANYTAYQSLRVISRYLYFLIPLLFSLFLGVVGVKAGSMVGNILGNAAAPSIGAGKTMANKADSLMSTAAAKQRK